MKVITTLHTFGASDTAITVNLPEGIPNLVAKVFSVTIPNVSGTPTATLAVKDANGNSVYSQASIAENTTTMGTDKWIPLVAGGSVTLTFTGAPGVSTSKVVLYCAEWI